MHRAVRFVEGAWHATTGIQMQALGPLNEMPRGGPGKDVFTVSRLNMEVRAALENSFPLLWVTGEISNLSQPRSGHLYFTLKDPGAQVRCALFRSRRHYLRFAPADGLQVLVRAKITLYEPRGDFQLVIEHMEPAGEGALRQRIEALRVRLATEGVFDAALKKPLPELPKQVGVITSPSGAAIRDVLTVLRRRFSSMAVLIFPVPVQGADAPAEISRMIALADARTDCDLLMVTRGGGSLEDLMAFNDEGVVRAIAACRTPIVCAIGHETDVTLAELAADRRAPTPSAAAELISPDGRELGARFATHARSLRRLVERRMNTERLRCTAVARRLRQAHPGRRLTSRQQRLDELEMRMTRRLRQRIRQLEGHVAHLARRLSAQSPGRRTRLLDQRIGDLRARLVRASAARLASARNRADALTRELHAVSPLATLGRGYAIVRRESDGGLVTRASAVSPGEAVETQLAEGSLLCRVEAVQD
jgi:exodeoxyribonuclease VII large subunit